MQCSGTATCSAAAPLTPLTGDALYFENNPNDRVRFQSNDPGINQNLQQLSLEFEKLRGVIIANGGTVTANSAYRPLGYQQHFWEICDRRDKLANNTTQGCLALKQIVQDEMSRHRINQACVVASPTACAPHTRGIAVDMNIDGLTSSGGPVAESAAADALAESNGIKLRWRQLRGDEVHFEIQNPIYRPPGC
jgi:hypothetical protein